MYFGFFLLCSAIMGLNEAENTKFEHFSPVIDFFFYEFLKNSYV